MFKKVNPNDALLEETITNVLNALKGEEPETDKYAQMSTQLERLYTIRNETRSRRVSPDTLATISANLLGIGIIVGHERTHIVTSKALGFVRKIF
jgi:hypothetical protein